jgi:hypothetical protein
MRHEDVGIHPQVQGNVDPAPTPLPKGKDHLGRDPGLPRQKKDDGELVGMDPARVPAADRLNGITVVITQNEMEVPEPIPIENHPRLHLS